VDLPEADFYSVEVAQRGDVVYSAEQLTAANWTVDLELGE
jgi:hypothetical protein